VVVVEFFYKPILFSGGPSSPISIGTDTSAPYSVTWTFPVTCIAYDYELTTVALDNCKNTTTSAVVPVTMSSCGDTAGESRAAFHWSSQLEAPGSAGRVLLNGAMIANGSARQEGLAQAKRDENRVDAELVQGGSRPGVWRFDFSAAVAPGSVRVLAGDALQVSEGAVVFRLTGTTGERVSFVFRARD
jgi:hypothetical protein